MATKKKVTHAHPVVHSHSVHSNTENGESTMSPTNTDSHSHSHHAVASESNVSTQAGETTMSTQTASSTSVATSTPVASTGLASILGYLASITKALGPDATPLTIDDRRRMLKMRPGGDAHVEPVMAAAEQYGLVLPGVDPAAVNRDLALLKQLGPIVARIDALRSLVGDVVMQAESRVWKATTSAYTTLVRYVPEYPGLQLELAPIASFLAIRFKDAPASLRPQERRALAKQRSKRKAGKGAKPTVTAAAGGDAASSTVTAPATPVTVTAAPQMETTAHAPVVSTSTVVPSAPVVSSSPVVAPPVSTISSPPVVSPAASLPS